MEGLALPGAGAGVGAGVDGALLTVKLCGAKATLSSVPVRVWLPVESVLR